MSDAPERIQIHQQDYGGWTLADSEINDDFVEYIRADLAGLPDQAAAYMRLFVEATQKKPRGHTVAVPIGLFRDLLAAHEATKS